MFPGLFTAPLRVADIFADPFIFAVPSYQRRFSWTVKEAAQLLDDLLLATGTEANDPTETDYFLGAILLTDPEGLAPWRTGIPRTTRVLEVVDGQQRLTTLAIMLAVLRDVTAGQGDGVVDELTDMLSTSKSPRGAANAFRIELLPGENEFLIEAVLTPGACLELSDKDELEPGEKAILEVRELFVRELTALPAEDRNRLLRFIQQKCHVVAIVASDVDHGHRMFSVLNDRGRPLARKDIIKAEVLGGVGSGRKPAVERAWEDIERRLGSEFDTFFSYVRAIRGRGKLPIIAGVRAVKLDVGGSEPFLFDVLLPLAAAFEIVCRAEHQGAPQSAEISRRLNYLSWLGSSEWVPSTIQWLNLTRDNPAQALRFLEVVEPFAYALRLQCIGTAKRATRCNSLLPAIAAGTIFDPERSPCILSREEQRHITANLRNLHERHPQTCKLVLLRLNDELAGARQDLDPAEWTVEHVLPQNPGRGGQWRTWFPDADERERLAQSLGNLVLIRRAQNDKASNQDFARKKAIYFKNEDDVPAITREIKPLEAWTPDEIKTREARFLRILGDIWGLDLSAVQNGDSAEVRRTRRQRSAGTAENETPHGVTEV